MGNLGKIKSLFGLGLPPGMVIFMLLMTKVSGRIWYQYLTSVKVSAGPTWPPPLGRGLHSFTLELNLSNPRTHS